MCGPLEFAACGVFPADLSACIDWHGREMLVSKLELNASESVSVHRRRGMHGYMIDRYSAAQ
jgi:hypothetical protein